MKPEATIMIPAYNAEKFIGNTLESAINQIYKKPYEILVVNDGSTDDTQGKIEWYQKKDNRIKLINQENKGTSSARNVLLDKSQGEILFGLDADDMLERNALNKVISIYNKYPQINHIYTDQKEIDEEGREIGFRKRKNVDKFRDQLTYNCHFQGHLKSFKSRAIGKKRFDENIKSAVDWEFFLNLYPSLNILHIPETLYYYRMNGNGISFTKREEVGDNSISLIKKYLDKHNVYNQTEVEVKKRNISESLAYYDHFINGKSTMNPEARRTLENFLKNGE